MATVSLPPKRPMRPAVLRTAACALLVALAVVTAACGQGERGNISTAGSAEAGTDIPKEEVKFAFYPCCADQAFFEIAIQKGFFEDVGISIVPSEGRRFTLTDQIVPAMQRGDHDVSSIFIQGYLQTLNTIAQDIPPILFHDIYVGYAILKAPDNPAKTTADYLEEGLPFAEAAKRAVGQLEGEDVYTPPHGQTQPPYPDVFLDYAGLDYNKDLNIKFLEDPKIVELSSTPGRVKWAIPYAAPVLVQLLREGWEPVIDVNTMFAQDNDSEQSQRMRKLVGSSGLMAQREWVEANPDTAIRLLSAVYRALDYVEDPATRQDGWKIEADLINASQGLDLRPADVGQIFKDVDPLFGWDKQGSELWDNPKAPFHVRSSLDAQVQSLINDGTLPDQEYDIDQFLVAEKLYRRMTKLQKEADGLFEDAEAADLSGEQADRVKKARQYYQWHDYLDSVRFLKAALDG